MPKGPKITVEVKRLIAEVNDEHPDWVAKEVKEEVQARLRRLSHQVNPNWPGITAIQIELRRIRDERGKGPLPIDGPWSIGRLAEYDIPPEALSKVLEIQTIRVGHEPLTIREAKWVGRLHTVTQDIMELAIWAAMYADREKVCELANIEKDTSDIDSTVRSKFVTGIGYFPWLFTRTWVPDSYKKQVAEAQTLEYEKIWGLNLHRPQFTLNGWLIYAHMLQHAVLYDKENGELSKELQEVSVVYQRQIAKNEGRVLTTPGKYLDLLECITKGVVREKSYGKIEEVFDVSSTKEMKELIDRLLGSKALAVREG